MSKLTGQIYLQPKQSLLYDYVEKSPETKIGAGGARGGAKSYGGRSVIMLRRMKYEKTPALIFRKTYPDLLDNHILPLFTEFPKIRKFYNKSEKLLSLPNGSSIKFGYAQHHDDIYDFYGKEYADILIDEATDLEEDQLQFLSTCNRCTTNQLIVPKMIFTMNPGRVGHAYIKRIFISKFYKENEDPNDYAFIPMFGWDNVEWSRKALRSDGLTIAEYYSWTNERRFDYFITRTDYGKKLNALPDIDRKAQLLGDWDVYEGQFFSMWNRTYHLIKPIKTIPPGQKLHGGLDYGGTTVLEVVMHDKENHYRMIAECYTKGQSPQARFNDIADMLIERKLWNLDIDCDTDMIIDFESYTGANLSPFEIAQRTFKARMGDKAPRLNVVSKHTTDKRGYRAVCNEAIKSLLDYKIEDGKLARPPALTISTDCRMLIETLPLLQYDNKNKEGLDFDQDIGEDHPFDAMKYAVMPLYSPPQSADQPVDQWFMDLMKKQKSQKGWSVGAG